MSKMIFCLSEFIQISLPESSIFRYCQPSSRC